MSKEIYSDADEQVKSILLSHDLFKDDLKKLKSQMKLHVEKIFLAGQIAGLEIARDKL